MVFFFFSNLCLTLKAMGIWRSADEFPVAKRPKEMREQNLLNARQPANAHRRVLEPSALVVNNLFCSQFGFI